MVQDLQQFGDFASVQISIRKIFLDNTTKTVHMEQGFATTKIAKMYYGLKKSGHSLKAYLGILITQTIFFSSRSYKTPTGNMHVDS